MADTSDPEIKFRDENEAVAENDQAGGDMADEREEDDSEVEIIHPRDHEGRPAFFDRAKSLQTRMGQTTGLLLSVLKICLFMAGSTDMHTTTTERIHADGTNILHVFHSHLANHLADHLASKQMMLTLINNGTCMAFESSLVSIGNSEENSAISVHLSKLHPIDKDRNHSDFWIGGNDIEYEGNFRWISSETDFGFTDWDDGQPDAPKYKQDCVQMQGLKAYKWHDDLCTLHHYFICEQEINEGPSIIGR